MGTWVSVRRSSRAAVVALTFVLVFEGATAPLVTGARRVLPDSRSNPAVSAPQPPQPEPVTPLPTPSVVDVLWNYDPPPTPTDGYDTTGTWPSGSEFGAGYVYSGISGGTGNWDGPRPPASPGVYRFAGDFLNRNLEWNPNGIRFGIYSNNNLIHVTPYLSLGGQWEHYEVELTFPSGTITWSWSDRFLNPLTAADNVSLSRAELPPPGTEHNPPYTNQEETGDPVST